jgi:UDP-glucose 4-epimerase
VTRRLADTRRAREALGFETEVDLDEGLTRLVAWWRAERAGVTGQGPLAGLAKAS